MSGTNPTLFEEWSLAQQVAECGEGFGEDAVVGPAAAAFAFDEPCVSEHLEVMADSWLAEAERFGQVADACFSIRLRLDEAEELQAGRVGDRL